MLLLYTLISVVMTWPLVAHLGGRWVMFAGIDEYQFIWNFWWMHHALADLHTSPLFTNVIYQPFGTPLALQADTKLLTLLATPITAVWGPETAYKLAVFLSFVLSAFTMYLLVKYLVGDRRAAFVGGCVFAFATFKGWQASGHLHIISTEFFPLYVLLLIQMLREPGVRYRHAAFAGLALGLILLTDYYQTVYAIFLSLCYLGYYLLGRDEGQTQRRAQDWAAVRATAGRLAVLGLVFLLVAAPLLYPAIHDILAGYYVKWGGENTFGADIAGFFVPGVQLLRLDWVRATFPDLTHLAIQLSSSGGLEAQVYAGWVVIILVEVAAVMLGRRVGEVRFWLAFLLLCFLFALGPQPRFLGNPLPLPGPYALWAAIPLLNNARIPARFDLLVTFAAAVLVGYAVREILVRLPRRWPRLRPATWAAITLALAMPLLLAEHYSLPLIAKGYELTRPAVFDQIAAAPDDFTVLTLPASGGDWVARSMYEQTFHQHPILNAYISRPLPDFAAYYERIGYLRLLSATPVSGQTNDALQRALSDTHTLAGYRSEAAQLAYYLDIGYIVAHPAFMTPGASAFLSATLPLEQVYSDSPDPDVARLTVYRVLRPALDPPPTSSLMLGEPSANLFRLLGWGSPQSDADGSYGAMNKDEAQLLAPVPAPAAYSITITLRPTGAGQTLDLYTNDETQPAATIALSGNDWQTASATIGAEHWGVGRNKLRLHIVGGAAVRSVRFSPP